MPKLAQCRLTIAILTRQLAKQAKSLFSEGEFGPSRGPLRAGRAQGRRSHFDKGQRWWFCPRCNRSGQLWASCAVPAHAKATLMWDAVASVPVLRRAPKGGATLAGSETLTTTRGRGTGVGPRTKLCVECGVGGRVSVRGGAVFPFPPSPAVAIALVRYDRWSPSPSLR